MFHLHREDISKERVTCYVLFKKHILSLTALFCDVSFVINTVMDVRESGHELVAHMQSENSSFTCHVYDGEYAALTGAYCFLNFSG